jgi:hypothetical protein
MMKASTIATAAAVAATLFSTFEAGAFELAGGSSPAANVGDEMIQKVVVVGRPGYRPAGVHPGYRPAGPGYHPGYRPGGPAYGYRPGYPGYRPGVPGYRPPVVVGPGVGWAARPSWYRWGPGGAIAAGAAIGFVTAATAVAWAGAPPSPGLCWYYTDPSRTQGFWDTCPY